MGFGEIIGHPTQIQSLTGALVRGRLHHAYVFVGPEGVGKRTVAVSLAKAIHCTVADGDFCDHCVACVQIAKRNHPDVRFLELQPNRKEISIAQVRELERDLTYRSFTGKKKIAIIDPAGALNATAQNALLKTLEEPSGDTVMILIGKSPSDLLPTVRSRCLTVAFAALAKPVLADYLINREGKSPEDAEYLSALAAGSLGAARQLGAAGFLEKRRDWAEIVGGLRGGDWRAAVAAAERLAGGRDEALRVVRWLETWYRDMLVYAVSGEEGEIANRDLLSHLRQRSARPEQILSLLSRTAEASRRLQRNLNYRMVLEDLLLEAAAKL
ncbi:MAG TPA: DNA polymerase III subunit delta' [candidate division Zixibacteria bacterium]|nr:DNA polymerase III subunit delta' [candidate division Zixibacteria bacterium]